MFFSSLQVSIFPWVQISLNRTCSTFAQASPYTLIVLALFSYILQDLFIFTMLTLFPISSIFILIYCSFVVLTFSFMLFLNWISSSDPNISLKYSLHFPILLTSCVSKFPFWSFISLWIGVSPKCIFTTLWSNFWFSFELIYVFSPNYFPDFFFALIIFLLLYLSLFFVFLISLLIFYCLGFFFHLFFYLFIFYFNCNFGGTPVCLLLYVHCTAECFF